MYQHMRIEEQDGLSPCGGATISWDRSSKAVGITLCSTLDRYSKKEGRRIADSRLKSALIRVMNKLEDDDTWIVRVPAVNAPDRRFLLSQVLSHVFIRIIPPDQDIRVINDRRA